MERTDGYIQDGNRVDFLFAHPEQELEKNRINSATAKLVYSPKFIPFYPSLSEIGLDNTEILLYWFIDFYLYSSKDGKFYFTNAHLSDLLNVSERKITDSVKSLKDRWLVNPRYRIRESGWKVRFINASDYVSFEWIPSLMERIKTYSKKQHVSLANKGGIESQDLLEIDNKINSTIRLNKNKSITQLLQSCESFSVVLEAADAAELFTNTKPINKIAELCAVVKHISAELDISPIYSNDTINAVDIILNAGKTVEDIIDFIVDEDIVSGDYVEDFSDIIRWDYYLPWLMEVL